MKKKLLSGMLALCMIVCLMPEAAFAENQVSIDETNFPDANFRSYVSADCDTDKDGVLSEAEIKNATRIYCSNRKIGNLAGIEFFSYVQELYCNGNNLTTLDVSRNTNLVSLACGNNNITTLDLSRNTALTDLDCDNSNLTALDVSNNKALETLNCSYTNLTTLDVSEHKALKTLWCSDNNQLTTLDASGCTTLEVLRCHCNNLTALDVSGDIALKELYCFDNNLTTLDVSENVALESLASKENNLKTLDVSGNTSLILLGCGNNDLVMLDVSKNTALEGLECYGNNITSLDLSKNTALKSLSCADNQYFTCAAQDRTFDLSTLPGSFDVNKAGGWTGGTVDGNVLTFDDGINTVTYTYDCGNTNSGVVNPTFTLNLHEHNYGAWQSNGNDTHTRSCLTEECGFSETENCYGGTATVAERAICEVCGQPYGNLAPQAVISGTNITGKVGNEITVDLNLDENPGLVSIMVEVDYDKNVLEYIGASNGDVFPTNSFLPPNVAEEDGKVLSWQNSTLIENVNTTGKLATLTFRIKDSASAVETSISFICDKSKNEALNAQGESVAVVTNAAKVNVILFYYGDVDNNDKIDAADALYLRRYLAKWNNYSNISVNAVDMDADGKVTIRDLTILERHIAGWNGYETLPVLDAQLPVDQN